MKIRKQPYAYHFGQPLLNKVLRVHVSLMHTARMYDDGRRTGGTDRTFYDAKTREVLEWNNWRVKLIRKFGT